MKRIILLLVLPIILFSQTDDKYPQAPEIWSKPEEITAISRWAGTVRGISTSADGKTLYISVSGIAVTELNDTGWTEPYKLGSHINRDYYVESPAITPSGNRLFYTWLMGNTWVLFYSNWDSLKQDWGEAINCGPEVNQNPGIGGVTAPDDTTIIFLRFDPAYIAYYNDSTKQYEDVKTYPGRIEGQNFVSGYGITTLPDLSKVYYFLPQSDTALDGKSYLKQDLVVSYDPVDHVPPSYVLNISYQADTLYFNGEYYARGQGYPTITADGKTLFFVANYHGKETVYISHLLVNENGDTVTSVTDENLSQQPTSFSLKQNYPNPFNPSATISFSIPEEGKVELIVYDMLGRKVAELVNETLDAGKYNVNFDGRGLSSGMYIYKITAGSFSESKKMIKVK